MASSDYDWSVRAEQLLRSHGALVAFQALMTAADEGNASAYLTIANWRMSGQHVRRDLSLAFSAYEGAAQLGDEYSRRIYIALLANGSAGNRNWPKALELLKAQADAGKELACLDQMQLDANGDTAHLAKPLSLDQNADIWCIRRFLSGIECEYLISIANPVLQPSLVFEPASGQMVQNTIRTSFAAAFPFTAEPPALHAINRRIASITSTTLHQAEPTQILRYTQGQQYRLHVDTLPASQPNQREMTFLVYLNEAYAGGETHFPRLNLKFRGEPGDALFFRNINADGQPNGDLRHASSPVLSGKKYILSKWIRQKPLDISGPPGRPF